MALIRYILVEQDMNFELARTRGTKVNIGRDENNDIVVPSRDVPLYYASVIRSSNGFYTLLSRNQSKLIVNGAPVLDIKVLRHGDIINVADSELKYLEIHERQLLSSDDMIDSTCPFCQGGFVTGDSVISCPKCDTAYHASCWGLMVQEECALPNCGFFIEEKI